MLIVLTILMVIFTIVTVVILACQCDSVESLINEILCIIGFIICLVTIVRYDEMCAIEDYHIEYNCIKQDSCLVKVDSVLIINGDTYKFKQ